MKFCYTKFLSQLSTVFVSKYIYSLRNNPDPTSFGVIWRKNFFKVNANEKIFENVDVSRKVDLAVGSVRNKICEDNHNEMIIEFASVKVRCLRCNTDFLIDNFQYI